MKTFYRSQELLDAYFLSSLKGDDSALLAFALSKLEDGDAISPQELVDIIKDNVSYIGEHGLCVHDITRIRRVKKAIEFESVLKDSPIDLDHVHVYGKDGKEYPYAILAGDQYRNGTMALCQNPGAHVSLTPEGELCHSISGGAFPTINPDDLKTNGVKTVRFWTWGSGGARGNGGLYFKAEVKSWTLHDSSQY